VRLQSSLFNRGAATDKSLAAILVGRRENDSYSRRFVAAEKLLSRGPNGHWKLLVTVEVLRPPG